ncbi:MAG: AMP-binding protein [Pseudonocardiales bacterium]
MTIPSQDIVHAFLRAARRYPQQPAIVHNGQEWDFARVERLVRAIAVELGPDCGVVGVLTTRSAGTVIAMLGVLAAGGAYCPIDSTFPVARQHDLARAAGCRVVITTENGQQPPPDVQVVDVCQPGVVDSGVVDSTAIDSADPVAQPGPEDLAYVLFTSGSTGAPKPVCTPRTAISTAVCALAELFGITSADRVLQFASLNWDTCFEEILPTLTSGAALVIDDEAYSGSLHRLLRMIERERVTVLDLPTAFWHELVIHLTEDRITLPPRVRVVVIGGEAARPARLADWCALDTRHIRLINTYGCTETTLVTHAVDLSGPDTGAHWDDGREIPIGRALPHVLEQVSEEGELLISGPSVALGYRALPEETERHFPILDVGDGRRRYFRTGDRVHRTADGMLVHRGRLDDQLKIRGIRVDPGEVEALITGVAGVAAVAVVGAAVADHTKLVAYVVPRADADTETLSADIMAELRRMSPRQLWPARITVVAELVYTASGKLDRAGSHRFHTSTS